MLGGGGRRGRRRAAPPRPRPLDVCGAAGAPGARRHDGRCPPRDGVPARARGHAHGRGREADDVPPHRARRARALSTELGLQPIDRRPVPLPGATDAGNVAARLVTGWSLEPAVAAHLAHFYGSRADRVVALAADRPALLERLHPDAPDLAAQAVFAAQEEWATSAADVIHRRTTLGARGLAGEEVAGRVGDLLSMPLLTAGLLHLAGVPVGLRRLLDVELLQDRRHHVGRLERLVADVCPSCRRTSRTPSAPAAPPRSRRRGRRRRRSSSRRAGARRRPGRCPRPWCRRCPGPCFFHHFSSDFVIAFVPARS